MSPFTAEEMTDPAAEETEVKRGDSKLLQQERPKIHHDRGPSANRKRAQDEFRCVTHVQPQAPSVHGRFIAFGKRV